MDDHYQCHYLCEDRRHSAVTLFAETPFLKLALETVSTYARPIQPFELGLLYSRKQENICLKLSILLTLNRASCSKHQHNSEIIAELCWSASVALKKCFLEQWARVLWKGKSSNWFSFQTFLIVQNTEKRFKRCFQCAGLWENSAFTFVEFLNFHCLWPWSLNMAFFIYGRICIVDFKGLFTIVSGRTRWFLN